MTAWRYDVFVTAPIPQHSGTLNLPSGEPMEWSPLSTTLIYGERDAVLIDPPFTTDTTRDVLDWVEGIGRNITDVYLTHGHGDHWFGTPVVLERFPNAAVRATAGTKAHMTSRTFRRLGRRSGTHCSRARSRRPPSTSKSSTKGTRACQETAG